MTRKPDFYGIKHEESYKQNVNESHHMVILRRESPNAVRMPHGLISLGNGSRMEQMYSTERHGAVTAYTNFRSRLFAGQYSAYSSQVQPALLRQHSSVIEGPGPRRRCRLRSLRNTRASTTLRNGYPGNIRTETRVKPPLSKTYLMRFKIKINQV
jgi:hypothetical protein